MADNTFLAPLSPIQRSTPSDRLVSFTQNELTIYNKFSPYYQAGGGTGPDQPFIYTKLTDSNSKKTFTARDTQALPVGSAIRDADRMIKFLRSGTGVLFSGKQILLQGSAIFDETRTYNAGSVVAATRSSLVGNRPVRHIEGSSGLLNFFASSILSTLGFSTTRENTTSPIVGTAVGQLAAYVQARGGGRYGVMRGETASSGVAKFNKIWVGASGRGSSSGFLSSVMRAVASTTGLFNNTGRPATWAYRPEYGHQSMAGDIYNTMRVVDFSGRKLLSYTGMKPLYGASEGKFYNDSRDPLNYTAFVQRALNGQSAQNIADTTIHPLQSVKFLPNMEGEKFGYARPELMNERRNTNYNAGLTALYKRMFNLVNGQYAEDQHPMYNKSAERYNSSDVAGVKTTNNYKTIPDNRTEKKYSRAGAFNGITIDDRGFAKSAKRTPIDRFRTIIKPGDPDTYNKLGILDGDRSNIPSDLKSGDQSKDLIFFYFYDLINKKYIPFRATITSMSEQNSPDWDELKYIGRADRLFIYKGFTRDVTFSFKVYANSIEELIPMWERVNYLTGLGRPSKYTGAGVTTNQTSRQSDSDTVQLSAFTINPLSGFIYPPMIEFRVGDLYVDQPGVIRSISVSIPDEASWETTRSDKYKYIHGINTTDVIEKDNAKSRQLPNIIDVTLQISLLEKQVSITDGSHFGPREGWGNTL